MISLTKDKELKGYKSLTVYPEVAHLLQHVMEVSVREHMAHLIARLIPRIHVSM